MIVSSLTDYSFYVHLMKKILPIGIVMALGFSLGWPYIQSISKEGLISLDMSRPEIKENRMVRPHYMSTDSKGQPYQVNAEWAKQRTEILADLINPQGSIVLTEGQTFNLKANNGLYDNKGKTLNLEGAVILTSTDGYNVTTKEAQIKFDSNNTKVIEGNSYIEGEGPTGRFKGQKGFIVETRPQGKKVLTLKGRSQIVIAKSVLKKNKDDND
jgi:hypothetical protein